MQTPTIAIFPTNYSSHFLPIVSGRVLEPRDKQILLAAASAIFSTNKLRSRNYLNTQELKIHGQTLDEWKLYIELNNDKFHLNVSQSNGHFFIELNGSKFVVDRSDINMAESLLTIRINDEPHTLQLVSKSPNGYYQIM